MEKSTTDNRAIFVAINKPSGITSHDVIQKLRAITGVKRIGHAGTLDPNATGVLVVGIGRAATKKISTIVSTEKEYRATIILGATSSTDDRDGKISRHPVLNQPGLEEIQEMLRSFEGEIQQKPPSFSAVSVDGVRAYRLARMGKNVDLPMRSVVIHRIQLESYKWPRLVIRVTTGKGVYIRSLARDIGERLQIGAYVDQLDRLRVGDFTKESSLSLEQFSEEWEKGAVIARN